MRVPHMHAPACACVHKRLTSSIMLPLSLLPQYLLVTALSDHEILVNSKNEKQDDNEYGLPQEQGASQRTPVDIAQGRSKHCLSA